MIGRYKKYSRKHAFHIPNTRRAIGGRATEVTWGAEDATYNCEPHAIDVPVDMLIQDETAAEIARRKKGAAAGPSAAFAASTGRAAGIGRSRIARAASSMTRSSVSLRHAATLGSASRRRARQAARPLWK